MVAATNSSFLRGAAHPAEMVAGGVGVSSSRAARRAARKERASVQLGGGAARGARAGRHGALLLAQLGQLLHHRAAELLGVDASDRATVASGHVVADADGQPLHRRPAPDVGDYLAQVALQIVTRIYSDGDVDNRRPDAGETK